MSPHNPPNPPHFIELELMPKPVHRRILDLKQGDGEETGVCKLTPKERRMPPSPGLRHQRGLMGIGPKGSKFKEEWV
jgi:hypothetical protein